MKWQRTKTGITKARLQKICDENNLPYIIDNWAASTIRNFVRQGEVLTAELINDYYKHN